MKKIIPLILTVSLSMNLFLISCHSADAPLDTESKMTSTGAETEITTVVEEFDDSSLDTHGVTANGSWFDSFESAEYWTPVEKRDNVTLEASDGVLKATLASTSQGQQFYRPITSAGSYDVEFRWRIEQLGESAGIMVSAGGRRITATISEYKIKLLNSGRTVESYVIAIDNANEWHTYRFSVCDNMADFYIDGSYITTIDTEESNIEDGFYVMGKSYSVGNYVEVPSVVNIDYISYTVTESSKLTITSPTSRQVCKGDVAVKVSGGDKVEFYLNDIYAGTSDGEMSFTGLDAGVYRLTAKSGDETAKRIFVVNEASTAVKNSPINSSADKLESGYILRFNVNGDGKLTAGDGYFPLTLDITGGILTYTTADGNKQITAANGEYIAVVDGGAAWLYQNGKLAASYTLPFGECGHTVSTSGGISSLTVEAHNATLYKSGDTLGKLPTAYALEFVYTSGKAAEVTLADGEYVLSLAFSEDGTVRAYDAPSGVVSDEVAFIAETGTNFYRVDVSNGIARVYINNKFAASLRLPQSIVDASVYTVGIDTVQIRETGDIFFWSGIDLDGADGMHILETQAHDVTVSATVRESTSGLFCLTARYDELDGGIFAGYDFDKKCFVMGTSLDALSRFDGELNGTIRLEMSGLLARLYSGDKLVTQMITELNGVGNVGWYGEAPATFDYCGDGGVLDMTGTYLEGSPTVTMGEVKDKLYIFGGRTGGKTVYESTDDGLTYAQVSRSKLMKYCYDNTIVLESGEIVALNVKFLQDVGSIYESYISYDNGTSFAGPYNVQEKYTPYQYSMNGKLMQTSSGRIIFASCESEGEYSGHMVVYYSDDHGKNWSASEDVSGGTLNLQEGCIVELNDCILRMYMRTDGGYLVYTDSYDDGETWDDTVTVTEFASVLSAFGVTRDKYTGAYYLAWEYNNANDYPSVQYPRTRIALAVSYDNCETWQYVGDVDGVNSETSSMNKHMNIGVYASENAVFVTAAKTVQLEGDTAAEHHLYTMRVDKASIVPSARFAPLRSLDTNSFDKLPERSMLTGTLLISSDGKRVCASGTMYDALTVDAVASLLGGTVNGTSVTVGGETYELSEISADAIAAQLGFDKTVTKTGATVLTRDASTSAELLLALAGMR